MLEGSPAGQVPVAFEYTNGGKRSIALDADSESGREVLSQLVSSSAAIVWSGERPGPSLAPVIAASESHGVITCFSHYGLAGPHATWVGSDYTDWAAGGYTYMTGYEWGKPRAGGGAWCASAAGLVGAFMTLGAWRVPSVTRPPGRLLFDVSTQDVMVFLHQWTFSLYTHQGVVKRRAGNRHAESYHPMGFLHCEDGWVCVGVASIEQWEKFCIAIDMPELIDDPRFDSGSKRFDNGDEFDATVAPWFTSRSAADAVQHLQQHDVPASKVQTIAEVLADEQLGFRGFWQHVRIGEVEAKFPGSPLPLPPGASASSRRAPSAGEHSRAILEEAGYAGAAIERLIASGTVFAGERR
jgi:crotonobetainyl-CoA:carnitine CoA-transferase CaiB-like acyl-CoA transferase